MASRCAQRPAKQKTPDFRGRSRSGEEPRPRPARPPLLRTPTRKDDPLPPPRHPPPRTLPPKRLRVQRPPLLPRRQPNGQRHLGPVPRERDTATPSNPGAGSRRALRADTGLSRDRRRDRNRSPGADAGGAMRNRSRQHAGLAIGSTKPKTPDAGAFHEAGDRGVEPRVAVLETTVLPIHQSPGEAAF